VPEEGSRRKHSGGHRRWWKHVEPVSPLSVIAYQSLCFGNTDKSEGSRWKSRNT